MLSSIKEVDIRRKLFRAEFQKTQTQMTSFLAEFSYGSSAQELGCLGETIMDADLAFTVHH